MYKINKINIYAQYKNKSGMAQWVVALFHRYWSSKLAKNKSFSKKCLILATHLYFYC